jgi:sugar O-acyltransferase (sialic acid O-acetyltransferase NeuD family)
MKEIVIFGTGGFAREVLQVALDASEDGVPIRVLGFLDGNAQNHGREIQGYPVLGDERWLADHPGVAVNIGVGNPAHRRRIAAAVETVGRRRFLTLRHPRSWIGRSVEIGDGSTICAGATVTTDIRLGRHVILNLNITVGHDAILEDFVTLAPGAHISGGVLIREGTDIGTGAVTIQNVSLGPWSIVGAGSAVVRDVAPNVTVVGSPAKVIRTRDEGWHLG